MDVPLMFEPICTIVDNLIYFRIVIVSASPLGKSHQSLLELKCTLSWCVI